MDISHSGNNLLTTTICHMCSLWGTLIRPVDININKIVFS